jgi:hypothetical protein
MAHSGHSELRSQCLLLGVKRTCLFALQMSAFDPKRKSLRTDSPKELKVIGARGAIDVASKPVGWGACAVSGSDRKRYFAG